MTSGSKRTPDGTRRTEQSNNAAMGKDRTVSRGPNSPSDEAPDPGSEFPAAAIDDVLDFGLRDIAVGAYIVGGDLLRPVKRFLKLVDRELRVDTDVSLSQKVHAYRHGFLSLAVSAFDFDENGTDAYLSQWQNEKAGDINGRLSVIHDDKLAFYYVLWPAFGDRLPELYGHIDNQTFVPSPFTNASYRMLADCLDDVGTVIVKPRDRSYGALVRTVEKTQEGYVVADDQRTVLETKSELGRYFEEGIVTERVEQRNYAREIYPGSANSIRIMTMIDPETGDPFIATASHRFGTERSGVVDNAAQGGLSTGIDPKTGRLRTSLQIDEGSAIEYDCHPDTGVRIEGRQIPQWKQIRSEICDMAGYLAPLTPYIGWDVIVTDTSGSFQIVEANSSPDVVAQAHEPLLTDDRVRRFYEHHDVL